MFCHNCGKEISNKAVVCVHCGVETKNFKGKNDKQINIVNQSSSSSGISHRRQEPIVYNGFVDFIMFCLTGGLWLIWIICRPKYREY